MARDKTSTSRIIFFYSYNEHMLLQPNVIIIQKRLSKVVPLYNARY